MRRWSSYRPLVRPVVYGTLALFAALVAWRSPLSPLALDRGDVLVGEGAGELAVEHYDRVARFSPWPGLRRAARLRAATVLTVELADPGGARLRLHELVEDPMVQDEALADAWERLGDVLGRGLQAHADAAAAYRMAYDAAPKERLASRRLTAAARALTAAGQADKAHQLWERLARKFPAERAYARLNQAAVMLASGRVSQALDLYEDALDAEASEDQLQVASLGAATCRERLGHLEAALAELGGEELPEHLETYRAEQLEERAADDL